MPLHFSFWSATCLNISWPQIGKVVKRQIMTQAPSVHHCARKHKCVIPKFCLWQHSCEEKHKRSSIFLHVPWSIYISWWNSLSKTDQGTSLLHVRASKPKTLVTELQNHVGPALGSWNTNHKGSLSLFRSPNLDWYHHGAIWGELQMQGTKA